MSHGDKHKMGLYTEIFETALRRHCSVPVRSEKQDKLSDLFVDNQQLGIVQNPDWQVIFGRRGTGKTMLLGVLRERLERDFEQSRVLAVSVTAQDLLVSPPTNKISDRQRALAYFQIFLESIAEQVVQRVDEILGSPTFFQRFTGSRRRLSDTIQETAIQILDLVQTGLTVDAFSARKEVRENSSQAESEVSADLGARASTNGKSGRLLARVSARIRGGASTKEKSRSTEELVRAPRFALARAKIVKLLDLLQVKRLNILIDEWQTLDPHASTGVQPEFAEYLKRTFFGVPQISVKIATNRYQTRFSNKGAGTEYRGLELGADLFEATNLDRTEQSLGEQVAFYGTLLFRRLVYCERRLSVFDVDKHDLLSQFILSMFRDAAAFEELVKGASATPRDFLLLFNSLAKARGFSNRPTWSVGIVHEAVRQGGANLQEETDSTSEADQLLTRCIRSVVEATGSRLFLVDRDDQVPIHSALEELVEKRLVDAYSRVEVAPNVRNQFDAYLVHYGLWLDWRPAPTVLDPMPEFPDLRKETPQKYKIRIDDIDTDTKTCPHCGDHFSAKARSFQVAGLCPQCFNPFSGAPETRPAARKSARKSRAAPRKTASSERGDG